MRRCRLNRGLNNNELVHLSRDPDLLLGSGVVVVIVHKFEKTCSGSEAIERIQPFLYLKFSPVDEEGCVDNRCHLVETEVNGLAIFSKLRKADKN